MEEIKKIKGRPKKYEGEKKIAIILNIVKPWRDIAEKLEKLSEIDESPEFKTYCKEIEETELTKNNKKNRLSKYCRYILSLYVAKNQNKLMTTATT
jgi:thiaminase